MQISVIAPSLFSIVWWKSNMLLRCKLVAKITQKLIKGAWHSLNSNSPVDCWNLCWRARTEPLRPTRAILRGSPLVCTVVVVAVWLEVRLPSPEVCTRDVPLKVALVLPSWRSRCTFFTTVLLPSSSSMVDSCSMSSGRLSVDSKTHKLNSLKKHICNDLERY